MTSDLDARAREEEPQTGNGPRNRHFASMSWPLLLAVGLVVYELTAQPGLGAAIACTKFGWDDFLTARWLRHRDPDHRRGRAGYWLFVAAGLWKTAVTGAVVVFGVAFLLAAIQPPPPPGQPAGPQAPPPAVFFGAFLAAIVGFGLSTVATLRALSIALWHRLPLWLDAGVHRDRRADRWPPSATPDRRNRAGVVLLTALFLAMYAMMGTTYAVCRVALGGWAGRIAGRPGLGEAVANLFGILLFLVSPVILLVARDLIGQLVLAASPAECWRPVAVNFADGRADWPGA
jgi:hypothetical protein